MRDYYDGREHLAPNMVSKNNFPLTLKQPLKTIAAQFLP